MQLWAILGLGFLIPVGFCVLKVVFAIVSGRLKVRHLPGPPTNLFFGCLNEWMEIGPTKIHMEWRAAYGDVFKIMFGAKPLVVCCDPTYAGQVMMTLSAFPGHMIVNTVEGKVPNMLVAEGDLWKFLRSATTPIFQKGKLESFGVIMNRCMNEMVHKLEALEEGASAEILQLFRFMALDVIGTTAFGIEINTLKGEDGEFAKALTGILGAQRKMNREATLSYRVMRALDTYGIRIPRFIMRWMPQIAAVMKCLTFVQKEVDGIIKERRKEAHPKDKTKRDFIRLLLEARDRNSGRELTDREVFHNSRLFLLAGHETTAGTLTFVLYHVAQNPEAEKKLLEEVDEFNDGRAVTYQDLEKYTYTEWVINESMRTLTIVPQVGRRCARDVHLGGTILVKKGSYVLLPIHLLHQDAKLWGDPETFRPERFDRDSKECSERHPNAFMPFGGGPRKCFGYKFAMMEMKMALVLLYRRFSFRVDTTRTSIPPQTHLFMTLEPVDGMYLKVHKRKRNGVVV